MTLIELTFASAVLAIAVVGVCAAIALSMVHQKHARRNERGMNGARDRAERLRGEPGFRLVYARTNRSAADDPGGPGTAPGNRFDVPGLTPPPGEPAVGEILYPEDAAGVLRENVALPALGMPRDLNGDGAIDAASHAGDYVVLPVLVRVRYRAPNGDIVTQEYATVLCDRSDPGGGP